MFNDIRDAAAVGITNVTPDGREVWICAVFDSGTVDVYQLPDLAGRGAVHQDFLRQGEREAPPGHAPVTDNDRTWCLRWAFNCMFFGDDIVAVYGLDFAVGTVSPSPEYSSKSDFEFKTHEGGSLRWGAAVEIVFDSAVVMHCTSKHYTNGCHINVFDPAAPLQRGLKKASASRRVKRAGRPAPEARPAPGVPARPSPCSGQRTRCPRPR